ncbi:MAG: ATP-binding protein [Pirellulales bacterium]
MTGKKLTRPKGNSRQASAAGVPSDDPSPATNGARRTVHSDDELARTRRALRDALEECARTGAALAKANDETRCLNEELYSVNAELDSSKEALRLVNEELSFLNQHLCEKNEGLEAAAAQQANLLANVAVAVLFVDSQLRIIGFTPAASQFVNLIPSDVGRLLHDFAFKFVDPSFAAEVQQAIAGSGWSEKEILTHDGRRCVRRISPYSTAENPVDGAVITFTDITELKQALESLREGEQRAQLAIRAAGMATWDLDLTTGEGKWSESMFRLLGYEPPADGKGSYELWRSRVHYEDLPRVVDDMERARTERGLYSPEYRIVRADNGGVVWVRVFARFMYNDAGDAVRFVGVTCETGAEKPAEEIHHEQVDEERLRCLQNELSRAQRLNAMGELAAGLAHELNQPLAALGTYIEGCLSQLVAGGAAPETLAHPLEEAARLTQRCGDIIRRVRRFVGRQDYQKEIADARTFIEEVISLLASDFRSADVDVVRRLEDSPLWLHADVVQIQQILLNLLRNAMEAVADQQTERRIWVQAHRAEPGWIEILVEDNGPGIPPQVAAGLFQPFSTTKPRGLGMGLRVSQTLAANHGGSLTYSSSTPGRTVFRLRLPAAPGGPR